MKTMSLLTAAVLTLSLSSTIVSGADGDCPSLRTVVEAACRDACGTDLMYQLCMDTLRDEFPARSINEVGEYGHLAARRALWAYQHTVDFARYLLGNASLSGEEKAAYDFCGYESYKGADKAMGIVFTRLPRDCFDISEAYKAALHDVEACRDRVAKLPSSPLLAMVKVDLNKTLLAYFHGKLQGVI